MTADGDFVAAHAPAWPLRLGIGAAVIALVAGVLAFAALVLWVASILIPVALVAGVVAYGAFRFQVWRMRRLARP